MRGWSMLPIAVILAAAGAASAKTAFQQPGAYKLELPDDFQVEQTGVFLRAQSPKANLKVLAESQPYRGRHDVEGHFARWERKVVGWRLYRTLQRVGGRHRVAAHGLVAFYRVYDAVTVRRRTPQPYRVFVLAAHSAATNRLYTLAIAAHRDVYQRDQAKIVAIASSFRPFAATSLPRPAKVSRLSLRGRLRRAGSRIVARRSLRSASAKSKIRMRDLASFARPARNSAWAALGFAHRPLKVGDAWRYAWSFRKRLSILKRRISRSERATPRWGSPIIIDYRVNRVSKQRIAGKLRSVAMISAIYSIGVRQPLQTGNELYVDHYWNPVQRCVYTRWMLHGRCRDRDTHSVIRSMGAKPLYIGDIEQTPARRVSRIAVAPVPPLRAFVRRMVGGKAYLHVPVQAGRRRYADTWWAPGNLVPSFVAGRDIQGILIGHHKAR